VLLLFPLIDKEFDFFVNGLQSLLRDFFVLTQTISCNEIIFLDSVEFGLLDDRWIFDKLLKFLIKNFSLILKCSFLLVSGRIFLIDLKVLKLLHRIISLRLGISNFLIVLLLRLLLGLEIRLIINNALVQSRNTQTAFNLDRIANVRTQLRVLEVVKSRLFHYVVRVKVCFLL
jgi:hypothetical protein